MRYHAVTELSPEEVLDRARRFYAEHTRMRVARETDDSLTFRGEIGEASIRVGRKHNHTSVQAETDRVVGLDVTDITKRFLYTIRHT